jgi:transposase
LGPITALALVLILGVPDRFRCGKQVGSYLGLIPCEESSGGRQRLVHISKQTNTLLRFLLIESAHAVVRYERTGAGDGIIIRFQSSVRTWSSPELGHGVR